MHTCNSIFARLGSCCLLSLVAVMALTIPSGCQQRPSSELRRRVESHLYTCSLSESEFPSAWRHIRSKTYDVPALGLPGNALGGVDAVFGPLGPDPGVPAGHGILAYRSPDRAAITFERFPDLFYDSGRLTPWVKPDLAQADLSPDAFLVGCAYYRSLDADVSRKRCHFLARYDRFLTTFRTWVSPDYMSEGEMVQVLNSIDERMLQCVDAYGGAVWEEKETE